MSAHIVMPAQRSYVPGHWVRFCARDDCPWIAHHPDRDVLADLARAHHENPDGDETAGVPA